MDVGGKIFALGSKGDFLLEHRGCGLEPFLRKNFEHFREKIVDLLGIFVKFEKPFIEEKNEIARFNFDGLQSEGNQAPFGERPEHFIWTAFALEGGPIPIERNRCVVLAFLRIFVLGEELIHPLKALFLGFSEVDLEEVGVRLGKIEKKPAGVVGEKCDGFDRNGIGSAVVDVFLEHEVLEEHGALIFAVHPFTEERIFFQSVDVFMETFAHRIEGIGEFCDFTGAVGLDRFSILPGGNGEG